MDGAVRDVRRTSPDSGFPAAGDCSGSCRPPPGLLGPRPARRRRRLLVSRPLLFGKGWCRRITRADSGAGAVGARGSAAGGERVARPGSSSRRVEAQGRRQRWRRRRRRRRLRWQLRLRQGPAARCRRRRWRSWRRPEGGRRRLRRGRRPR